MSGLLAISDWRFAMDYRLAIGDFVAGLRHGALLIANALQIGNRQLQIAGCSHMAGGRL